MSNYSPPKLTWAELGQALHGFFPGTPKFTEKSYPYMDGKVVLITGGSTGLGYQTVKSLAASTNAKVYIFGRNEEKTLDAIKKIELEVAEEYQKSIDNKIRFIKVDLSDLSTIKPAVDKFLSIENRLDVIIHNAGVFLPPVELKSAQGHELQSATNAIGPHLLHRLLDDTFIETAQFSRPNESRVVWISATSQLASPLGGIDFDDPNMQREKPDKLLAYAQSKAVNAVQARQWAKEHADAVEEYKIVSVSVCPGFLASDLGREFSPFMRWFLRTFLFHNVRKGAYTVLYAAFSPDISTAQNGRHIISWGQLGLLRKDLEDGDRNLKVWSFLDEQVSSFVD